jgi:hypothetical protein
VLAIAVIAAGCGGGDDAAVADGGATPPTDPAATGVPVADPNASADPSASVDPTTVPTDGANTAPGATEDIPGANEIANADASAGAQITVSAITPKKFASAHCTKPIMVVLYQPESILDGQLYKAAKAAAKAGPKDLVTLAYTPADVKGMGDLPSKLGLLSTPGLATVGRDGTIENFWTTYVDSALIGRSLANAAASKPCRVATSDVPTAGSALADATTVANGGSVVGTTTDPLTGTPPGTPAVEAAPSDSFEPTIAG